jgi:hypothetical protein
MLDNSYKRGYGRDNIINNYLHVPAHIHDHAAFSIGYRPFENCLARKHGIGDAFVEALKVEVYQSFLILPRTAGTVLPVNLFSIDAIPPKAVEWCFDWMLMVTLVWLGIFGWMVILDLLVAFLLVSVARTEIREVILCAKKLADCYVAYPTRRRENDPPIRFRTCTNVD